MIQNGLWTERAADTLLGYAYMQKGVEKVDLHIDTKTNLVTFKVRLEKKAAKQYNRIGAYSSKSSIWYKFLMLRMMQKGVPAPGSIENTIIYMSKAFLPAMCKVEVQLVS